jgi:type I restriction enzyme S subunit
MPDDWEIKSLDKFCNIFTGRKNANEFDKNGKNKFFTCGPTPLQINSYIYDGPAVIISGNGAYTGRTRFYNGKFDLYQRTYACTISENIKKDYIYLLYFIIKNVLQKNIAGGTHGSAVPYIVLNDIAKFELHFKKQVFDQLSTIMKTIINEILHNEEENERLVQLRDTLLPKLMSGEIDVENVDISTDKLLFNEDS